MLLVGRVVVGCAVLGRGLATVRRLLESSVIAVFDILVGRGRGIEAVLMSFVVGPVVCGSFVFGHGVGGYSAASTGSFSPNISAALS